jgi:hypothetical protein
MAIHIPQSNGHWQNPQSPGNSVWFPDLHCIPQGSNDPYRPYTFKRLIVMNYMKPLNLPGLSPLKIAGVKVNLFRLSLGSIGIRFSNSEPDFRPFAIATVKIKPLLDNRYGVAGTMTYADKLLASRLGLSENTVRQWINDNQYVWHERQDGRHIDLLSHDIHGNIPHTGGISKNRERLGR